MRDGDDEMDEFVPVRPYASASIIHERKQQAPNRPVRFRPILPSQREPAEKVLLASAHSQDNATAEQVLMDAWRAQQSEGGIPGRSSSAPSRFAGQSLSKFGIGTGVSGLASTANVLGNTAAGGITVAPRKLKEKREGKSQDLMDLAFTGQQGVRIVDGQPKSNYTPISLPYFDVREEDADAPDLDERKKTRPAMVHVDEANANAAKELFLSEHGDLQEGQLLLMQLPAIMPELQDPLEEVQREHEDAATAGAGATITRIPDGKLGKLRIYKSGKVRMEIGGVEFAVDQGCDTFFQQDLACVCPLANEAISLGPIRKRIVVTPDLASMLSTRSTLAASRDASAAAKAKNANSPVSAVDCAGSTAAAADKPAPMNVESVSATAGAASSGVAGVAGPPSIPADSTSSTAASADTGRNGEANHAMNVDSSGHAAATADSAVAGK